MTDGLLEKLIETLVPLAVSQCEYLEAVREPIPVDAADWWANWKLNNLLDATDKLRKSALAKLTVEEIEALHLEHLDRD